MNDLSYELNALMEEWNENHRSIGLINFISDGAVNADVYEGSSPKIVFFLKEAYSKTNESWSLTKWLDNGAMTKMWGNVAEWTYGIQNTSVNVLPHKPQLTNEEKTQLLKSIAIVNVKKSNGNLSSDYEDLLCYAETDSAYLKRELDILNPDIIVCGNNSSLLRVIYGAEVQEKKVSADGLIDVDFMKRNGYAYVENKIIIDYYHPANHYPAMLNYYTVCSLYQQALKKKGFGN